MVLDNYKDYITAFKQKATAIEQTDKQAKLKHNSHLVLLLSEASSAYLQYWKYEESEEFILEAVEISGLQLDLTGRMGRLTKYQQFDTAQLILNIKSREVEFRTELAKDNSTADHLYVKHGDDSILLEAPSLNEDEE